MKALTANITKQNIQPGINNVTTDIIEVPNNFVTAAQIGLTQKPRAEYDGDMAGAIDSLEEWILLGLDGDIEVCINQDEEECNRLLEENEAISIINLLV